MSRFRPWIGAFLNFFFPGLGYFVSGGKPKLMAAAWLLGALGLTYVETSIQTAAPAYYWPMFASVFVMNIAFAVDAYREGKARQDAGVDVQPTGQVATP